jgi:hypothetical protein
VEFLDDEDSAGATIIPWIKRLAILGCVIGVVLMFRKETLIAESGWKPDDLLWYWFWIPVMGVVGGLAGVIVASLVAAGRRLMEWAGIE